ncbi:ribonuclease P protein component [Pedobacter faecalis]|uniref:ribonuclease P protein component n=1 Tax=Pedobacter faecalis TaxID=3041495 RepID=UPI00254BB7E0|nr:ribonuclease P protein component [Pedobacter sp. ELA7]
MNTFRKEERLCSKKLIDLLFKNGSSFLLYPFRVSYLLADQESKYPCQVLINVSKKRYKRAVDRNLIKRRSREAYRLNKAELLYPQLQDQPKLLLISVQYIGKTIYDFEVFEKKMIGVFKRLHDKVDQ